jgi:GNAT superfamily N-acetyltransferase
MMKLVIRLATHEDIEDIAAISRTTWDGEDYLEGKAPGWIEDGSLFAGLLEGKVIGTFRLSPMPASVIWMEALRVREEYKGRGYGRELASAAFGKGKEALETGKAKYLEFSTYFNNVESIHISRSQGFRVVNRFLLMTREGIDSTADIDRCTPVFDDFSSLSGHIACGWKYPQLCQEGADWALNHCDAYRTGNVCFLRRSDSNEVTPLNGAAEEPDLFLDGAEVAARLAGDKNTCIVLHESSGSIIEEAYSRGYNTWEPVETHNILVFRYTL